MNALTANDRKEVEAWHSVVADLVVVALHSVAAAAHSRNALVVSVRSALVSGSSMLCKKPFMKTEHQAHGCGQCLPCRLNLRRLKTHRMMLEQLKHGDSSFLTLTYDDEHLPPGGTLVIRDYQTFIKRLRYFMSPRKLRYVFVGEYGDISQRPHYHAALFGIGPSESALVRMAWKSGHIHLGDLSPDSAQYIAGYVTKKLTNKNDPQVLEKLKGKLPEFSRTSLRPGIGATALDEIVKILTTDHGVDSIIETGDVPSTLRHGSKQYPLGRYLRMKLREKLGFKEINGQKETLEKFDAEMRQLHSDALKDPKIKGRTFKAILLETSAQKVLQLETKNKIYKKKGTL